jgi:hypothetical protein
MDFFDVTTYIIDNCPGIIKQMLCTAVVAEELLQLVILARIHVNFIKFSRLNREDHRFITSSYSKSQMYFLCEDLS